MADQSDKSIAQIAYETFLEEIAKTEEGAAEAKHAPPWEAVPPHVRIVIAEAVGAAVRSFAPALICDVDPEDQEYAQVGYQAYIARTGGLNYQGLPCPEFEALTPTIKAAWASAATAIRTEHEHRSANDYDLAVSKEELAELVAGLDAAQRSEVHNPDVCFPLRARLRAVLLEPEPEPDLDEVPLGLTPDVVDDPKTPDAATEPASADPTAPETTADPSATKDAPGPASEPPTQTDLPKVSEAPPAPELKVELPPMPAPSDDPETTAKPDPES